MDFKNINFTDFIRYSLTGLNFILFAILLPIIYFAPDLIKGFVSETSVLTILLFSIAIGYIMDMLKVYQFTPNYNKNKAEFRKQISNVLEVPIEHAASYFSITSKMWDENSTYNFERRRAEWVLISHTAAIFFISMFIWIIMIISDYLNNGFSNDLFIPILITLVTLLLTVRLYKVGTKEIAKNDREILLIMNVNKKKIKDAWKLFENKNK